MNQKNVLIVDDDEDVRKVISTSLEKDRYRTVTARNGNEGLEKVKEDSFDIAFVDIKMPDISGVQVLQSIKKSSPETVVVLMTGYASVETAVETLKSGAYDYITKPFKMDSLREIIEKAIESPGLPEEFKEDKEEANLMGVALPLFKESLQAIWRGLQPVLGKVTVGVIFNRALERSAQEQPLLESIKIDNEGIHFDQFEASLSSSISVDELRDSLSSLIENTLFILSSLTGDILKGIVEEGTRPHQDRLNELV